MRDLCYLLSDEEEYSLRFLNLDKDQCGDLTGSFEAED